MFTHTPVLNISPNASSPLYDRFNVDNIMRILPLTTVKHSSWISFRPKEYFIDPLIQLVGKAIVRNQSSGNLRFSEVIDDKTWKAVLATRLKVYNKRVSYLLSELDSNGQDELDCNSFVFVAWWNDQVVATVRANLYPYEALKYLDEQQLAHFLGNKWKSEYIEWGRLVVDDSYHLNGIMPGLIRYAGLRLLFFTHYRFYFGYTRSGMRRLLWNFQTSQEDIKFSIPKRGEQIYSLFKGQFASDVWSALIRFLQKKLIKLQLMQK